jgi:hypothetical protein
MYTFGSVVLAHLLPMDVLPPELILKILSYLPIPSLSSFQLISRRHREIVCSNESYLYRNAALLHHFIPSRETTLADVKNIIPRRLERRLDGWRSYCEFIGSALPRWIKNDGIPG